MCCEIYVCVYHGYHSCVLGVTFLMTLFHYLWLDFVDVSVV
jgi:hypothetical protein